MSDDNPISWQEDEDPVMVKAIQLAQDSFADFTSALHNTANIEESLVKYMFPCNSPQCHCEHMFVSELEYDGTDLYGFLCSTPQFTTSVHEGDRIKIENNRVSDWLYVIDGKGTGGHTFKAMWAGFASAEKNMYRDQPPFCWLSLD